MNKRMIAAIVAATTALVGIVMVASYVNTADSRAREQIETVPVLVATKVILAGQGAVVGQNAAVAQIPAFAVAQGAVTDPAGVEELVASVDIAVNEQILGSRFGAPGASHGGVAVPEEFSQVTVPLSVDRSLGGILEAGDTVGVLASYYQGSGADPTTSTVMHRVLVSKLVALDAEPQEEATADNPSPDEALPGNQYLVTLAADSHDLEKIVWAAEHAKIWLTLETDTSDVSKSSPVVLGTITQAGLVTESAPAESADTTNPDE